MLQKEPTSIQNVTGQRLLLGLMLFSILLLTACGNNGNEQAVTNTASPTLKPTATVTQVPESTKSPAPSIQDPVATTLSHMTLEEKVGQMLLVGIEGTVIDAPAKRMISEDQVGGIILYGNNISNLPGMVKLINHIKETNSKNPAPLFISVDQEGGKVSRMPKEFVSIPSNRTVGNTDNALLAQTMGELLGRELKATGFNMNFAPVLDVNSNSKNPIIGDRSFGMTADRVTKMGLAEIEGLRSEGIIPVVKHYPGHGDTSVDSHLELPVVNKTAQQLAKLEWIPFQAAIKDNIEAVMVAHILFPKMDPDQPASLSKVIIDGQLRGDMGYNGVVITDDLTMGAIVQHFTLAEAAIHSIKAGSDILLIAHGYDNEKVVYKRILQSVKNGTITEARINESVQRILTLKNQYKLSDNKTLPVPNITTLNQDIRNWRKQVEN